MNLLPATVIVTEGGNGVVGRFFKWAQRSDFTHCILVTGENEFIEADGFRQVSTGDLSERINRLNREHRTYIVLDMPGLTEENRTAIVQDALTYKGRLYDYWKVLKWFFTRRFVNHESTRLTCSRLITVAFWNGAGIRVFKWKNISHLTSTKQHDLSEGLCVPVELILYGSFDLRVYDNLIN